MYSVIRVFVLLRTTYVVVAGVFPATSYSGPGGLGGGYRGFNIWRKGTDTGSVRSGGSVLSMGHAVSTPICRTRTRYVVSVYIRISLWSCVGITERGCGVSVCKGGVTLTATAYEVGLGGCGCIVPFAVDVRFPGERLRTYGS
jgi:hypothetical protein